MHKACIPPVSIISFDTEKMTVWKSETSGLGLHNANLIIEDTRKYKQNDFSCIKTVCQI